MRIIALSTKGGDRDVSGSCTRASPQPRKELRELYSHLVTYLVICTPLVIGDRLGGVRRHPRHQNLLRARRLGGA
jgi:hypothetical protein